MNLDASSSLQAYVLLRSHFNPNAEEVWVMALNSQLQVIAMDLIFRGTVDHCLFHPRDIFRFAIANNACSFILAHNHPSGLVDPSLQDLSITRKLFKISLFMQIPLQDHIVFDGRTYFSMADHGYFKSWKKGRGLY